jgi:hypothetical protein
VSSQKKKLKPDFTIARTKTPQEVIALLLERFPVVGTIARLDELYLAAPFHAYECFAAYVRKRTADRNFLQSVGSFITEMADSNDPLIGDVLVTSLLEGIAEDPDAAERLSGLISEKAGRLLTDVERKIYGRFH